MAKTRKTWFIRSGRFTQGPISSAELAQMARAGMLKPESEVSHLEDGPWRPARAIKRLVFPTPELPPLPEPEPFDSFADPVAPKPPQDGGIDLEGPKTPPAPEPEPVVLFDAAPVPTASADTAPPATVEQSPSYVGLRLSGWIVRIAAILCLIAGGLAVALSAIALSHAKSVLRESFALSLGGGGVVLLLTSLLLFAAGQVIDAFIDLVRDSCRHRIVAERAVALLEAMQPRQT